MTERELLLQFAGYLSAALPGYTNQHPEEIGKHVEPFLQAARAAAPENQSGCTRSASQPGTIAGGLRADAPDHTGATPNAAPAEPERCFKCGHPAHGGECVNVAPVDAAPVRMMDLSPEATGYVPSSIPYASPHRSSEWVAEAMRLVDAVLMEAADAAISDGPFEAGLASVKQARATLEAYLRERK